MSSYQETQPELSETTEPPETPETRVIAAFNEFLYLPHKGNLNDCDGTDCLECEDLSYLLTGETEFPEKAKQVFGMDISETLRCANYECGMLNVRALKSVPGGHGRIIWKHFKNIENPVTEALCDCEHPKLEPFPMVVFSPPPTTKLANELIRVPITQNLPLPRLLEKITVTDYHLERARRVILSGGEVVSEGSYLGEMGTGRDFTYKIQTLDFVGKAPITFQAFAVRLLKRKIAGGSQKLCSEEQLQKKYTELLKPIARIQL